VGWLQNAFARRAGARHELCGHLFGGRYKGILIEPGNCFWALFDYIHLNPMRAGINAEKALQSLYDGKQMEEAPKSSLTLACSGQCFAPLLMLSIGMQSRDPGET
jgi:hypothetical protein